jgi:hypothetical protein
LPAGGAVPAVAGAHAGMPPMMPITTAGGRQASLRQPVLSFAPPSYPSAPQAVSRHAGGDTPNFG